MTKKLSAKSKNKIIKNISNKPSYREEANALIHQSLRSGFIEDLHAGKNSEVLEDQSFSRITQEEMKKIMVETTAQLAMLLELKDKQPIKYNQFINCITLIYTHDWEKKKCKYLIKTKKNSGKK